MLQPIEDAEVKNLFVCPDTQGRLTYSVSYYLFERPVKLTLGVYERSELRVVRMLARIAQHHASKGIDPAYSLAAPDWQETAPSLTFGRACTLALNSAEGKEFKQCQFIITHLIPAWSHRKLEDISADEVTHMVAVAERHKSREDVAKFIQVVYNLAYIRGYLAEEQPYPLPKAKRSSLKFERAQYGL